MSGSRVRRSRDALFRLTPLASDLVLLSVATRRWGAGAKGLTAAEIEVARLAASGLSNAAIARRRGRSLRTVANQVAAACAKVGVSGRRELRAALARRT